MILEGADKSYDAALAAVDGWFNTQMDRVSGVYRRWITLVQAGIALVVVVLANADTIAIIRQLSKDATVSQALSALGERATANQSVSEQMNLLVSTGLQLGWTAFPSSGEWALKVCGLGLTFAAVMLGAPFWFDLLKQIVPVRTEGVKPHDPGASSRDAQRGAKVSN